MEKQRITDYLNEKNKTLICLSNRQSGWQRHITCSVSLPNPHRINSFHLTPSIVQEESAIFMWLCYVDSPFVPLECRLHILPIQAIWYNQSSQKINFSFDCSGSCFERSRPLALLLVQCHQNRYQWNLVEGEFRKFGKRIGQTGTTAVVVEEEKEGKPQGQQLLEVLFTKIQELESEVVLLKNRVAALESSAKEESDFGMDYFLS